MLSVNREFFYFKIIQNLFTTIVNAIEYGYIFGERCYQIFLLKGATLVIIIDYISTIDANRNNSKKSNYVLKFHSLHPFRKIIR